MAKFTWIGDTTGSFEDPANWYNDTKKSSDDGFPGAGDTAIVNADEVTVDGDTIADLRAFDTDIVGDVAVTSVIENGVFSGGDVKAGRIITCIFEGVSLTANRIDNGNLDAGRVTVGVLVSAAVDGATVTAQTIERVPKDQYATTSGVGVDGGSLIVHTMTLVGGSDVANADNFAIVGGTATITGEATVTGANAAIDSDGGTLVFREALSLSSGASFDGSNGGKTTVDGALTVGKTAAGSVVNLNGAGTSLTVDGNLIVGVNGSASVTVDKDASLVVKGKITIGEHGSLTDGSATAQAGYLTIGAGGVVDLDGARNYSAQTEIDGGTLELFSTGAAGKSAILFEQGHLELVKGAALGSSIADFNIHDTIELEGLSANKDSFSKGVLTLFEGNKVVSKLNFTGNYNPFDFHVSEVGGSAIVTYSAGANSESTFASSHASNALFSWRVSSPWT